MSTSSHSTPHPSAQDLAAFARGALARDAAAAVEEHLDGCPRCRQIVRDLREETGDDEQLDAAWTALRARLPPARGTFGAPAARRALLAAAALLVFVAGALAGGFVIGRGGRIARLEREIEELRTPHAQVAEVDLFPRGSTRGARGPKLANLSADTRLVLLNLLLVEAGGRARLEIFDGAGRRVSVVEGIAPDELGKITVALPRGVLETGTYLLQLFAIPTGGEASAEEPVAEYEVRIADGQPS